MNIKKQAINAYKSGTVNTFRMLS